jgi:hypothetical protein
MPAKSFSLWTRAGVGVRRELGTAASSRGKNPALKSLCCDSRLVALVRWSTNSLSICPCETISAIYYIAACVQDSTLQTAMLILNEGNATWLKRFVLVNQVAMPHWLFKQTGSSANTLP